MGQSPQANGTEPIRLQIERDSVSGSGQITLYPLIPIERKGSRLRAFYNVLEMYRNQSCVTDTYPVSLLEIEF